LQLKEELPVLPVPLKAPDDDLTLPLGQILNQIYEEAGYDNSIDYQQPPPPPVLSEEDAKWVKKIIYSAG